MEGTDLNNNTEYVYSVGEDNGTFPTWRTDSWWYLPIPVCGLLGLIGNSLITLVMLRERFRGHALKIHLLSLSISDSVIILSYFYFWVTTFSRIDSSEVVCKTIMALRHVFLLFGSWTVVFISVERCFLICQPHLSKAVNFYRTALIADILLFVVSVAFGIPITLLTGRTAVSYCHSYGDNLSVLAVFIIQLTRALLYYITPFVIISICSSVSIMKLRRNEQFWKNTSSTSSLSSSTSSFGNNSKNTMFATWMLIVVGMVFATTTFPYGIYKLYKVFSTSSMAYTMDRVLAVVLNLNLVNHCVNFYQYCLTGAFFREELKLAICRPREVEAVVKTSSSQNRF